MAYIQNVLRVYTELVIVLSTIPTLRLPGVRNDRGNFPKPHKHFGRYLTCTPPPLAQRLTVEAITSKSRNQWRGRASVSLDLKDRRTWAIELSAQQSCVFAPITHARVPRSPVQLAWTTGFNRREMLCTASCNRAPFLFNHNQLSFQKALFLWQKLSASKSLRK